jgi:cytidylate kinase
VFPFLFYHFLCPMHSNKINVAIDGYSSCGKSTLAKAMAKSLNYTFIDTGAMYRGVTYYALQEELIQNDQIDEQKLIRQLKDLVISFEQVDGDENAHLFLNGKDVESIIRGKEVSSWVSHIAKIKEVREFLVEQQRNMGKSGGVVMDGRDIGSVVFPNAELKLFITASPEVRTERRYQELQSKGVDMTKEEVHSNLMERDRIDTTRKESPLIKVEDAIEIDNSNMTREEQLAYALKLVDEKINSLFKA